MTASYIYFIQAQSDGPIKIGTTRHDPRRRMVKIQSDCPWPVSLLGTIEGTVAQEKEIHLILARWRTQGEWFEPHATVLAAVAEALRCGRQVELDPREVEDEVSHPLKRWRLERDLTQDQVAGLLGTDKMSVSRWECGVRFPHRRNWGAIERVTGISAAQLAAHTVAVGGSQ